VIERSVLSDDLVEVFALPPDVDAANSEDLGRALGEAVSSSTRCVVLDLSETRYLDSSAIDMLFKLNERLRFGRRTLRLVVPADSPLHRLLQITSVPTAIDVDSSLPEAVAAAAG
jgi:anti-anti-sigma factor